MHVWHGSAAHNREIASAARQAAVISGDDFINAPDACAQGYSIRRNNICSLSTLSRAAQHNLFPSSASSIS